MRFKTPQVLSTTVVVGNTLPALLYSYLNDIPIIINKPPSYNSYDFLPNKISLNSLRLEEQSFTFKKSNGFHVVGTPKKYIQDMILFNLSMCGLVCNTFVPTSVRIKDENTLTVFSMSRRYEFAYEKIHLFDCENVSGVDLKKENIIYEVYDKMDIKHSNGNDVQYIQSGDNFVNEIYIHPSERNGAKKDDKDLVCKSILTKEQLNSFDYSDTIARIKVTSLMRENGFCGPKAGVAKKTIIKQNRRPLSVVTREREVYEKYNIKCLELNDNIVINNSTEQEIIGLYKNNHSSPRKKNNILKMTEVLIS